MHITNTYLISRNTRILSANWCWDLSLESLKVNWFVLEKWCILNNIKVEKWTERNFIMRMIMIVTVDKLLNALSMFHHHWPLTRTCQKCASTNSLFPFFNIITFFSTWILNSTMMNIFEALLMEVEKHILFLETHSGLYILL